MPDAERAEYIDVPAAQYRVASFVPKRQVRLVRNPHFREWSHAARPAGYADEIVIRIGGAPQLRVVYLDPTCQP